MKKVIKSRITTFLIILAIVIIAYFSLTKPTPTTDLETIQCIGEKSTLYVQLGCSHCETQEKLFGDNLQYINRIDCFYSPNECTGIPATPTWEIGSKKITGVQTIEQLKELTKC